MNPGGAEPMNDDKMIRMKFGGLLLTVMTLTAWGMWHLMMVE